MTEEKKKRDLGFKLEDLLKEGSAQHLPWELSWDSPRTLQRVTRSR